MSTAKNIATDKKAAAPEGLFLEQQFKAKNMAIGKSDITKKMFPNIAIGRGSAIR